MVTSENLSGFPMVVVEKTGPEGTPYDVVVVRGTFDFSADGLPVELASVQAPICYGDEFDGPVATDPLKAVLRREGDLVLFKPATDVHVIGTAMTPGGTAQPEWLAGIGIGPLRKSLRLLGPRSFNRNAYGDWYIGTAEKVTSVRLDYRNAFGGSLEVPTYDAAEDSLPTMHHEDNPAGCGWLPDPARLEKADPQKRKRLIQSIEAIKSLPAPQIEHPNQPVRSPHADLAPEGFGPVARWSQQRLRYAGTYDDAWEQHRQPMLPEDFDPRFYQSAHPDLICPGFLNGYEHLALAGMLPEGPVKMRLPGVSILIKACFASGHTMAGSMRLDTVTVDIDAQQVTLIWRAAFSRDDALRSVAVGSVVGPGPFENIEPHEELHHG